MSSEKINKLKDFLFEVGTLRKLVRSHRQTLLTDDLSDNIAAHSYRVAIIGYFLATMEKVDTEKVLKMCLFHDVEEVRSGDQNWVHKRYVKVFDDEIIEEQLRDLPGSDHLLEVKKEYRERKSLESRVAKDADLIDQVLLLKEYEWNGNKEATKWLSNKSNLEMLTQSGKKLVKEVLSSDPSEWSEGLFTSQNR